MVKYSHAHLLQLLPYLVSCPKSARSYEDSTHNELQLLSGADIRVHL
jgi:hypothetical protein